MNSILLCSIDSFLAAAGIGLLEWSETKRRKLILAFAMFDLIATFAGLYLRTGSTQIDVTPLVAFAALALFALVTPVYRRRLPGAIFWIPALLSLDNLIAGWLGESSIAQSPLSAGLCSGLLAWAGFEVARMAKPLVRPRSALLAGISLMVFAFAF
jgi:putative Mn2+ efflux pump MntP